MREWFATSTIRPDDLLAAVEGALDTVPAVAGRVVRMTELTQELVRRAIRHAVSVGREQAESYDLFVSILAEGQSGPALILRHFGTDGEAVTTRMLGDHPRCRTAR